MLVVNMFNFFEVANLYFCLKILLVISFSISVRSGTWRRCLPCNVWYVSFVTNMVIYNSIGPGYREET